MSRHFGRTDTSVLGQWWWTVDRWMLICIVGLIGFGVMLGFAASPPIAERLGAPTYHFVIRQFVFLVVAVGTMFALSLQSPLTIRRIALLGFLVFFGLTAATLIAGHSVNGASRWLRLGSLSIQPSELMKPCFVVLNAWLLAAWKTDSAPPTQLMACGVFAAIAMLLAMQPDFGMAMLYAMIFGGQFFLAGLALPYVVAFIILGLAGAVLAYAALPHVQSRVDRFLDPASGDTYQIQKAMQAFENGGWFGRGPGEGRIKEWLPDAHTDFVFAVAGEEFGIIVCLALVALFGMVVLRGFALLWQEPDRFARLATAGLLLMFGLQALINMASSLHLMPTKGMTLPFVSYGGSSLLSVAMAMGFVLALTRRKPAHGRRGTP